MKDDSDKREAQTGIAAKNPDKDIKKDPKHDQRQDRLKLALRENLKRRKSQARARDDVSTTPSKGDDASPHDGSQGKDSGENPGE
jgi:hypothetical protein